MRSLFGWKEVRAYSRIGRTHALRALALLFGVLEDLPGAFKSQMTGNVAGRLCCPRCQIPIYHASTSQCISMQLGESIGAASSTDPSMQGRENSPSERSWEQILAECEKWAELKRPRQGDVPLIFYRDANSWCPYCHRVWFFLEAKGLRYKMQRIHLGGDIAEPPKQAWYRQLVPSGVVPAIHIHDEVVPESLDILYRLEHEFPEPNLLPKELEEHIEFLCQMSQAFNHEGSEWMQNRNPSEEEDLLNDMLQRLQWLESALAACGGPFLCGDSVTLADAAYVGFLTRLAHNALYFKNLDIRDASRFPNIASWFSAMEGLQAYQVTKQDAFFEQRIYQAHPERRAGAEACMQLGPIGSCVGEPDCSVQPKPPTKALSAASLPALEAAFRISARRQPLISFLLRQHAEVNDKINKELVAGQLQTVALVLTGHLDPAAAFAEASDWEAFRSGPVASLGNLIGTPRDMSSAALAQVNGALQAISCSRLMSAS